jgi:hypothetical protein
MMLVACVLGIKMCIVSPKPASLQSSKFRYAR